VTATRTETKIGDTAASVRLIDNEALTSTSALTVDDALRQVPGVILFRRTGSRTANPTSQGVSLRGVGASGASRALVFYDDVPLNDSFGGWVYWSRVPRVSIDRIEVLRGGASNLYGSAALGGVVQVISRDNQTLFRHDSDLNQDYVLSLESSYGTQTTPDASIYIGGRIGRWSEWSGSIAAEGFYTNGYIPVEASERGFVDTPAASKHTTLNVTLNRSFNNHTNIFVRGSIFGEARRNGTPLQDNRTHLRELSIGADWTFNQLGDFKIRASINDQVYDQSFSTISADRNSETLIRGQRVPAQSTSFFSQWSKNLRTRHQLVAGFDIRNVRATSDEQAFVAGLLSSLQSAGGKNLIYGIFALETWRLTNRIILSLGG
ncbi:MAG: TonB-dependent receptor, partial [Pyrinomonadaceae bacterium]